MAKDKNQKKTADTIPKTNPGGAGLNMSTSQTNAGMTTNNASNFSYSSEVTTTKTTKKADKKAAKTSEMPNLASLSPEQMNQLQLEEAIKESQNPSMKLKKLRSPLSVRGCFLNILFFTLLTLIAVYLYIWIFKVDKFNFVTITKDILNDSGIAKFFTEFFKRIANLFTGKGWTLDLLFR